MDENDWDIYYWATQNAPVTEAVAEVEAVGGKEEGERKVYGAEEWAQTVGKNREPYRPPPSRWQGSKILGMLREHVREGKAKKAQKDKLGGLGSMPALD